MMRTKIKALAAVAAVMLCLSGCSDDGGETSTEQDSDAGATTTVSVDDNFFEPESVEVSVGDTVTWEWVGVEPHNVVADDFESEIKTEGSFEHTFDDAGSHTYVCTVHPGMEGTVEVTG